ncbi:MAG TPA: alpha/beta hydrolase [Vineibacter sp.]|nr:alpha/beta hydrolase [Vineibacter sp.]
MTEPRFVTANNLRFAYLERGQGPLVLMLHGFPDNALTYMEQMAAFAAAGYRVVSPYLRGYAPTEIPSQGACDPVTLGQDVKGLITALNPGGTAYVVGMDWGGTAIQAALVQCPELIEAAVVMNAAHPATLSKFATDPEQVRSVFHFWFFQADVAAKALAAGDLAMVDYLWQLWSPGYEPGDHLAAVKATLAAPGVLPVALRYYGGLYRAAGMRTFPMGEITVPTLSIFGAQDPTAKYAAMEADYFKGPYKRIVMPDVGHWPHRERPDDFRTCVLDWFESSRQARRPAARTFEATATNL